MIYRLLLTLLVGFGLQAREAADKPNIIFVLLDDLGKEWLNCYGGENIETPRIDELAASGIKFDNAYSMPQCTPSRVAFMTGQYPLPQWLGQSLGLSRWGGGYFDWTQNPSIARTMKSAGYTTAVAGKWQLNDFRIHPDAMVKHGFDDYCMWTGAEGSKVKGHSSKSSKRYWDPYIHTKEGSKTYPGKFGPDIYNQFVLDFISENKEKPFFIYYPMALPHGPLVHTPLKPNVTEKYDKHRAMVHYIDYLTGKLIDHLESLKIRKNTIIVWTCDNGTSGGINNNMNGRSVKGGKTKTTENGVNTPFIVSCPGLVPEGKTSKAIVDFTDMHQTFADFAGAQLDKQYTYDGKSAKEVFLGKQTSDRDWIMAMGSKPARMTDAGVENVHYFETALYATVVTNSLLIPSDSLKNLLIWKRIPQNSIISSITLNTKPFSIVSARQSKLSRKWTMTQLTQSCLQTPGIENLTLPQRSTKRAPKSGDAIQKQL